MHSDASELNRHFGVPGVAEIVAGESGLPVVRISTPQCSGEVYLHGAHVTSWKPTLGEEVLFVSSRSRFEAGKAIRGGVPICFPWFGNKADDAKAPAHGLVRTRAWKLDSIVHDNGAVGVDLSFENLGSNDPLWPRAFRAIHRVTFGTELRMELVAINTANVPQRVEEAQHAYYRIGDVHRVKLLGLSDTHYIDKTDTFREKRQDGDVSLTSETDRIYLDTEDDVVIDDPVLRRRITVAKQNSRTTVVWNPWEQKAAELPDLGEGEWRRFVCVETTNVGRSAIEVAPAESCTMSATVSVEPY